MPSLHCPSCSAALQSHEDWGTESLVCEHCCAIVGISSSTPRLIGKQGAHAETLARAAPLKLGARGELRGKTLEVTGILERCEGEYRWFEIALADEHSDISWLWVDRGHFSLCVCESAKCVSFDDSHEYVYSGQTLRLFGRGKADFYAALGEFPFELTPNEHSQVTDYIAPPFVASFEAKTWWVFEYVPVREIEQAFGVSCAAPRGVGCNEPAPLQQQKRALGVVTLVALFAAAVVHSLFGRHEPSAALVNATIDVHDPKNTAPQSFGPIRLERRWNSLDVVTSARVDNAWTDLTLALVNQETGRSYWTSHGVEFYRGVDSDGPWTEGSNSNSTLVRSIPAGTYTLLAHGETGTWSTGAPPSTAYVQIYDRPAPTSNLMVAVGAVLAVAGLYVWLSYRFEAKRWAFSDLDPPPEDS